SSATTSRPSATSGARSPPRACTSWKRCSATCGPPGWPTRSPACGWAAGPTPRASAGSPRCSATWGTAACSSVPTPTMSGWPTTCSPRSPTRSPTGSSWWTWSTRPSGPRRPSRKASTSGPPTTRWAPWCTPPSGSRRSWPSSGPATSASSTEPVTPPPPGSDRFDPAEPSDGADLFDGAADVVVVGTGAAGLAAAVAAAARGASVVVLESADHPGGTTAKSGGTAWIPNNHLMRDRGVADDRSAALRYMARRAHPDRFDPGRADLGLDRADLDLLEAFFDRGSEALADLVAVGAMEAHYDGDTPDYHVEDNAAPFGRRVAQR